MLLQGLKMVVLPLIIFSIISGVASLDSKTTGKLGGYAVAYYGVTTILAVIIGIIMRSVLISYNYCNYMNMYRVVSLDVQLIKVYCKLCQQAKNRAF